MTKVRLHGLLAAFLPLLSGAVSACGGEATPVAKAADTPARESKRPAAPSNADDVESDDSAAASADPCADGSCFRCGDGSCPSGWYCDEDAPGGAACAWLPECAQKVSCGCLTKTLGNSCSCEQTDGGAHVHCK